MNSVELPWMPTALRPNASSPGNWRRKSTAAKKYRADCIIMLRAQGLRACGLDRAHLTIRFSPPDNRRRDIDNMLASFKHGIDAISESIGVDDSKFGITIVRGPVVKGGRVEVYIHPDDGSLTQRAA